MKILHIAPRRWGKTIQCVKSWVDYWNQGGNACLVVRDLIMARYILRSFPIPKALQNCIVSQRQTDQIVGHFLRFDKVFLDEFLYLKPGLIRPLLKSSEMEGWSTAPRIYQRRLFDLAVAAKNQVQQLTPEALLKMTPDDLEEYQELYDSFLTDPDAAIIPHAPRILPSEDLKNTLNNDQVAAQFLGEFLTL